ncbi:tetratricopeptide repeat protein [Thalassobaculum sp. OXR-137]|uniref:tetratricopeptide repeat protein n=1 Tax=Thalassobaculum sp. OXR-137 TaxID=3100173 RepID=UPI002AC961D7|nr:tetratricopeptide repeat protein [Thalassobaculum sp. OXR-137]WPZ34180.1 tetratricopeptide repeat protein [Thalassobaculum sp. OXR-137]
MSAQITAALDVALQAHRAGRLDKAIAIYGAVLDMAPDQPTARHLRGFALLQSEQAEEALGDLRHAVRIAPGNANAWMHLAICLDQLGQPPANAARRALLLLPQAQEAVDVLVRNGGDVSAVLDWLMTLAPGDPTAWIRVGHTYTQSDPTRALRALRRAHCLSARDPSLLLDLADAERRASRSEKSLGYANRSLACRPNDPRGLAVRAAAEVELDAVSESLADSRRAAVLAPGLALAWANRAEALYRLAEYAAAVRSGDRARIAAPSDPDILANLAAYRLATGDLAVGWPLLRYRPTRRRAKAPELPRWQGESGARLLVLAEQGLGDELLFSTLWHDLDRRVEAGCLGSVTIEADARLIPLCARTLHNVSWRRRFQDDPAGEPVSHWCLAADLMEYLRPTVADFGDFRPGLSVDASRSAAWKAWLAETARGRPTIGLCWRSSSLGGHRRRHYPPLGECAPLLDLKHTLFVILQYDDCQSEIDGVEVATGSEIVIPPDLNRRDDQDGVAALISALDMVTSADTAVLALTGALGRPAVAFSLHPGWVGLGQSRHPWFPSVTRVYRPPQTPWRETMAAVARILEAKLARHGA